MVIELTQQEQQRLTAMANQMQRSEAELAQEAMHWFLAPHETSAEIVARSRAQIAEGKTIDHDVLFDQIDEMLR